MKPENNSLKRWKKTKYTLINSKTITDKGPRMAKDRED